MQGMKEEIKKLLIECINNPKKAIQLVVAIFIGYVALRFIMTAIGL